MNENSSQNYVVKYADEVLLGLSCHLNFNVVKSFINIESFLRVYTICIDRNKIDASIRKSALEQMTIVMFLEIVSNLTHALGFLLFDQSLLLISLSDQEFQQQKFSIDFVFILIVN
ncbi:unnamed protein product [Rotaria magnacalcarata]|uniref:Uncharacterized protein n=1 Tax=Rotaria magnacalcarata TaxID=392030 RepID=A0A816EFF4_9BILA|nr:unnamed protein product [Rotaria magnacalcarata]CAF1646863.1 unnamed protein product [Rotaria magnacalcarata]